MLVFVLIFDAENVIINKLLFPVKKIYMFTPLKVPYTWKIYLKLQNI